MTEQPVAAGTDRHLSDTKLLIIEKKDLWTYDLVLLKQIKKGQHDSMYFLLKTASEGLTLRVNQWAISHGEKGSLIW